MPRLSIRPAFRLSGRPFRGVRGWAGKPAHPPLTDVPVGAYVLGAGFDAVSFGAGPGEWSSTLYDAATVLVGTGLAVSPLASLTGLVDRARATSPGSQVRRTVNAHGLAMGAVTVAAAAGMILRLFAFDGADHTPALVALISVGVGLLTAFGAALGGSLVYDYGFNVETAGDHPAWRPSESDSAPWEIGDQGPDRTERPEPGSHR